MPVSLSDAVDGDELRDKPRPNDRLRSNL